MPRRSCLHPLVIIHEGLTHLPIGLQYLDEGLAWNSLLCMHSVISDLWTGFTDMTFPKFDSVMAQAPMPARSSENAHEERRNDFCSANSRCLSNLLEASKEGESKGLSNHLFIFVVLKCFLRILFCSTSDGVGGEFCRKTQNTGPWTHLLYSFT